MLKLNAGFSRKVGEPHYGSRGASVNVELELESGLIGDQEALLRRIQQLFEIAKRSVDAELAVSQEPRPSDNNDRSQAPAGGPTAHIYRGSSNGQAPRLATASQVRAIRSICQRQRRDADRLAHERFQVAAVDQLTVPEASTLIDELKAAPARNGGGR